MQDYAIAIRFKHPLSVRQDQLLIANVRNVADTIADASYLAGAVGGNECVDFSVAVSIVEPDYQVWAFPSDDGASPFRVDNNDSFHASDENIASILRKPGTGQTGGFVYECKIEGSYETLDLTISVRNHRDAAEVYRGLLKVSQDYQ